MSKDRDAMSLRQLGLEYQYLASAIENQKETLKKTIDAQNEIHAEICSHLENVPNAGNLDIILVEGGTAFIPHWEYRALEDEFRCNDFSVASEMNGRLRKA